MPKPCAALPLPARTATARMARWRRRQAAGEIVAPVAIGPEVIGTLIDLGWLAVDESEDRFEIARAISQMLTDLAASGTKL